MNIQTYSDVVAGGLILPRKNRYTKRDVDNLLLNSLFKGGQTLTPNAARFIVKCSAIYYGTEWSQGVARYR